MISSGSRRSWTDGNVSTMILATLGLMLQLMGVGSCDEIRLGEVIYGDSLIVDPDFAFNVRFNHSRGTYLLPSFNAEGFVTESKSSHDSVHLPDESGCHDIVYLDTKIAILNCLDSTIAVDLKQKKVVSSLKLHCLSSAKFESSLRLICQTKKGLAISDFDLKTTKFGKEQSLGAEFPIEPYLKLADVGGDTLSRYFRWVLEDSKEAYSLNDSDLKLLRVQATGQASVFSFDKEMLRKSAVAFDEKELASVKIMAVKNVFIVTVPDEDYDYVLLAAEVDRGLANEFSEGVLFDAFITPENEFVNFRYINASLDYIAGDIWSVLSAQISAMPKDGKILNTVEVKLNSNSTKQRHPDHGLFSLTFSFVEDISKELTATDRKGPITEIELKDFFDATFSNELDPRFFAVRSNGKLQVFSDLSSSSRFQLGIIAKDEGWNQIVYIQCSDMVVLDETLYALVEHSNNDDAVGSSLLKFDPLAHTILKIDTRHSFSKERNYRLEVKYIMNRNNVTIDSIHFNLTDKPSKLVSLMNEETHSKLAVHNANNLYFWPIPFDNEMIRGPYRTVKLLEPKDAVIYKRDFLLYKLLDDRGKPIKSESAIVLEGHMLKIAGDGIFQVHNCYPFEANYMKTWCRDIHVNVSIEGQILAMRQTPKFVVAIHKAHNKSFISIVDIFKGKATRTELCSNMSEVTLITFGSSVYFATVCNKTTVEIWTKQLLNQQSARPVATYSQTSTPSIKCPQKLQIRKDKKIKLAIFDECAGETEGEFYDIEVDITGQDFRHIKNFVHEKAQFELTALCGHRSDLVALINGMLFLFKDDNQYLTLKLNTSQIYSKVDSMTCLDHGRILIISGTEGLVIEIEKLFSERYHPHRRIKNLPSNKISYVFEDEDSITINFVDNDGKPMKAGYFEFDSPIFFVSFPVKAENGTNVVVSFSNGDTDDDENSVQIKYPIEVKEDYNETCTFKLKGDKILVKDGYRIKLRHNPQIEYNCELWTLDLFYNAHGSHSGISVNQAMNFLSTLETDVQTFTSYRGGLLYAKAIDGKTQIYSDDHGRAEVALELKIGDYCVDSDMVYFGDEDWYAVFACFNNYKSYLVFASDQLGDLRIVEIDGYHTDPRVRVVGDHHVYLFTRLPHRDIVLGYYTENIADSKKPVQFYSSDKGNLS